MTRLEHVSLTVSDIAATGAWLADVFGWRARWSGGSIHNGTTAQVGDDSSNVALDTPLNGPAVARDESHFVRGRLNPVAAVVDDLDVVEARVKAVGFVPTAVLTTRWGGGSAFATATGSSGRCKLPVGKDRFPPEISRPKSQGGGFRILG